MGLALGKGGCVYCCGLGVGYCRACKMYGSVSSASARLRAESELILIPNVGLPFHTTPRKSRYNGAGHAW